MKIALGIIARPVESLLVRCLRPIISHFDGVVILTSPNPAWKTDVAALVHKERKFSLFDHYEWANDYGHARNILITHTEKLGYDWMMTLDADESMLPDDVIVMRRYIDMQLPEMNLIVPRYEFVDDFNHFCPWFYPDWHPRAFRLNCGYYYVGNVHETLVWGDHRAHAKDMPNSITVPLCPIFHYGKSKPTEEVFLKYSAYHRISVGLAPFSEVPPGTELPKTWALDKKKVPFFGNRPL